MKINNNNNYNVNNFQGIKKAEKNTNQYKYDGEIDNISGTVILKSDKVGWFDAQKIYYINKDGSGRELTAWTAKNFPKSTFSFLNDDINEIKIMNGNKFISEEQVKLLMDKINDNLRK